jgi:hypothetical protein
MPVRAELVAPLMPISNVMSATGIQTSNSPCLLLPGPATCASPGPKSDRNGWRRGAGVVHPSSGDTKGDFSLPSSETTERLPHGEAVLGTRLCA